MADALAAQVGAIYDQCAGGGGSRRLLHGAAAPADERAAAALAAVIQAAGLPALAPPRA